MKRLLTLLVVAMLAFTACGDSGGGSDDPGDATNCDELVSSGLALFQDVLDAMSGLSLADLASEEEPAALQDLESRGEELDQRASELGCDEDELSADLLDRIDELDAEGEVAEFFLEQLKSDPSFLE